MKGILCPECDAFIAIPADAIDGEILMCADCGEDYQMKGGKLEKAEKVAEDFGE